MAGAGHSWKLSDHVAAETQGFIPSGFGGLEAGTALFLEVPSGGSWLRDLQAKHPITAAISVGGGAHLDHALSIAFTWSGLQAMGLPEAALASFSAPFREGMFQTDRLRRLGDRRSGKWLDTTGGVEPKWSGNTPLKRLSASVGGTYVGDLDARNDQDPDQDPDVLKTEITVHAALLIYAQKDEDGGSIVLERVRGEVGALLQDADVSIVHELPLVLNAKAQGVAREHFGFADGLSQPEPADKFGAVKKNGVEVKEPHNVNGVPLGEIMIGYENGHQEPAPGPIIADDDQRLGASEMLPKVDNALGFYDLGKNGSYLVVRELYQDVAAFWTTMEEAAETIRTHAPSADHITAKWLAEKVVGRDMDGHVLRPDCPMPAGADGKPVNDFEFFDDDRYGVGCPLGSHVRRAHPRDSLAPSEEQKPTLLQAANNHRILRRARKYGPTLEDQNIDDGRDRGLLFMCLNTDIARQFEFVQQTWLLNSDFHTLFEEIDPLVGSDGWMTIPQTGLRRRVRVKTFVHMNGGEYFFMPSISAVNLLTRL